MTELGNNSYSARPHGRDASLRAQKPMLTVGQQIAHLKAKGVTFKLVGEDEAAGYLSRKCNYYRVSASVAREVADMGIPKRLRSRKLRNPRMQQIATLLSVYASLVPGGSSRSRAVAALKEFFGAFDACGDLLPQENPARSSIEFVRRLTVGFGVVD